MLRSATFLKLVFHCMPLAFVCNICLVSQSITPIFAEPSFPVVPFVQGIVFILK